MTNLLKFENGVAEMDLPTLKKTVEFTDIKGNYPKPRPENHATFLEVLMQKAEQKKVLASPGIIYADKAYAGQVRWNGDKTQCPVENHLIQRLVTTINLNLGNSDMNMALAVSYTEKGLSVAYGLNVRACQNQNIFGQNIIRTYGENKVPYEKMLQLIDHWFNTLSPRWEQDFEVVKELSEIKISKKDKFEAIGEMMDLAVVKNMGAAKDVPMMLNQTQVGDFLKATHDKYPQFWTEDGTAWDFLQSGTQVLKPHKADFVQINDSINQFSNFVINRFGVKYDANLHLLN